MSLWFLSNELMTIVLQLHDIQASMLWTTDGRAYPHRSFGCLAFDFQLLLHCPNPYLPIPEEDINLSGGRIRGSW